MLYSHHSLKQKLKGNSFIHLLFGIIPACFLFIYSLFLLKVFHRFGIFRANFNYSSANPISYILVSLSVFFIFSYFLYLALLDLKYRNNKDFFFFGLLILSGVFLAFNRGPFFQPPSDPIFHSGLLWDFLSANTFDTENRALISKSIFATIYFFSEPTSWSSRFNIVLTIHSISILFLILSCFVSGRLYGLTPKWSFFSSFIFILFFGTNQFSYISYYSLAPTSINLSFVWLVSALLLRNTFQNPSGINYYFRIFYISLIGLLITPLLYYNHKQESGFLLFVFILAYIIIFFRSLSFKNALQRMKKWFVLLFVLILFFPFGLLSKLGSRNIFYTTESLNLLKDHITNLSNPWLFGNINGPRVFDTLGLLGFAPLIVFLILILNKNFLTKAFDGKKNKLFLAIIPGLLPFWIILIPFNLFIWMKGISMSSEVFWRFCYISQFWISISYFLYKLEMIFTPKLLKRFLKVKT